VSADAQFQAAGDGFGTGVLLQAGDRAGDTRGVGQRGPQSLGGDRNEDLVLHVG
jgi:hypothetical protein